VVITNRLLLRTPQIEDLDAYVAVFTHPEVSAWMRPDPQPPATAADIEAMVEGDRREWEELGFGPWAVFDRAEDSFVGRVGLQPRNLEGEEAIEVAWAIDPARHGEGLATEAALAALKLARQAGLDEVVALVQPTNLASRAVAAKAGFREAGKIEHAGLPHIIYRRVLA
jgi:RimJ/RimL family protein N-acetyltransferase